MLAVPGTPSTASRSLAEEVSSIARSELPGLDARIGYVDGDDDEFPSLEAVLAHAADEHKARVGADGQPDPGPAAVVVPLLAGPDSALLRRIRQAMMNSGSGAELTDVLGPHPLLAEALHVRLSEAGLARADRARLFTVATAADGIILATVGGEEAVQAAGITGMLLAARLAVPVLAAALDEEGAISRTAEQLRELRFAAAGAGPVPDRPGDRRRPSGSGRGGGGLRLRRGARRLRHGRPAGAVELRGGGGHHPADAGAGGTGPLGLSPERTPRPGRAVFAQGAGRPFVTSGRLAGHRAGTPCPAAVPSPCPPPCRAATPGRRQYVRFRPSGTVARQTAREGGGHGAGAPSGRTSARCPAQGACRTPDAPGEECGSAARSTVLHGPLAGRSRPGRERAAHGRKFMSHVDVVRAAFAAYLAQDRAAMDRLLAEDYVFTSPQDDHIGKAAFLEVCFPTADRLRRQEILDAVALDDEQVCVRYEYELKTGERHRNVEVTTVRDGRLTETQVYFGGRFPQG